MAKTDLGHWSVPVAARFARPSAQVGFQQKQVQRLVPQPRLYPVVWTVVANEVLA